MYELVHCALSAMEVASLSLDQGPWYRGFDFIDPRAQALLPLLQYDDRRIGVVVLVVICAVALAASFALVLARDFTTYEKIFLCIVIFGIQPFLPIIIASYVKVNSLLDKWLGKAALNSHVVEESSDTVALRSSQRDEAALSMKNSLVFWIRLHEVSVTVAMTAVLLALHAPFESGAGFIGPFPFTPIILLYPLPFYGTGIARWRLAIPLIWVCTVMTLVPIAQTGTRWDFAATRHRKIIITCWTGVAATGIYIGRQIGLRDALRELIAVKQSIVSLGKQRDDLELLVASALPERVRTCAWERTVKEKDGYSPMSALAFLDVPSTVVFADVVGFTNWCSKRSVMEIVSMLSSLFDELDRVAASIGICKVKTLGDAYWAVAGLVDGNPNHAGVAVEFALTLAMEAATRLQPLSLAGMRVGVHTGLVSGGLIGPASRKSFEVFGAANQIAEDVQTAGQPGRVLVSEATRSKLLSSIHHHRRYVFADGPIVSSLETLHSFFASHMEVDPRSECAEETDSISERISLKPLAIASPTDSLRLQSLGMIPMPIVPLSEAGNAPPQQNKQSDIISIASAGSLESIPLEKRTLPSFSIPKSRLKLHAFLTMIDQEDDAATALQANTPTFLSLEVEQTAVERFTPLDEPIPHDSVGMEVHLLDDFSASRHSLAPAGSGSFGRLRDSRRNGNPLEVVPSPASHLEGHDQLQRKSFIRPEEIELDDTTPLVGTRHPSKSERDQSHGTDRLAFVYGYPLVLIGYPFALSIGDAIRFDPPSGTCYLVGAIIATAGYISLRLGNWNFRALYCGCFVPYYIVMMIGDYLEMRIVGNFLSIVLLPLIYVFWSLWIWVPWYLAALLCLASCSPLYVGRAVGWAVHDTEGFVTIVNILTGVVIVALGSRSARLIADRSAEDKQVLSDAEAARKKEFKEMESTAKCLVPPSQVPVLVQWLNDKRNSMSLASTIVDPLAHVLSHVVVCFVEIHLGGQSTATDSASALLLASQLTTALEECIVEGRPSDSVSPVERIKMIGDAALLVGPLRFSVDDANGSDSISVDFGVAHMLATVCSLQNRVKAASTKFGEMGHSEASSIYLKAGLSVGSVVAAVVGRSGLMFDVFGDSVNRASRSKSHCPPGSLAFEYHSAIEAGLVPFQPKLMLLNRFQTQFKGISTPIDLCVYKFNDSLQKH